MKIVPPNTQQVVLCKIYPWSDHNLNLIMHWLYEQARNTGFTGTFEDFSLRYGQYMEDLAPAYEGEYHITPLTVQQILDTKNKILNENIVIDPIPSYEGFTGQYRVTPMAHVDQILRTSGRITTDDIIVEQIPYYETSNDAGGYTVIIG